MLSLLSLPICLCHPRRASKARVQKRLRAQPSAIENRCATEICPLFYWENSRTALVTMPLNSAATFGNRTLAPSSSTNSR